MYPEEIGDWFPLPIDLHRTIRFQLAGKLIKEKLRFPTLTENDSRCRFLLSIENTPTKNVYMMWHSFFSSPAFTVKHLDIGEDMDIERTYSYYKGENTPGYCHFETTCPHGF